MFDIQKKINKLPPKVKEYLLAQVGVDTMLALGKKYSLKMEKLSKLTKIITDIYIQEKKPAELLSLIKSQLKIAEPKAKQVALDLAGQRLLIADDYFNGQISKLISKLGGKSDNYQNFIAEYKNKVKQELNQEKKAAKQEQDNIQKNSYVYQEPEKEEAVLDEPQTAEQILQELENILKNNVMSVLTTEVIEMKIDLNVMMTDLLLEDKSYQQELINALTANQELITQKDIIIKGEKADPTVANWILDFVSNIDLQEGQTISTLQKAKYYNESTNIKNLDFAERQLIDKLFDFYENLINFYPNSQKLPLSEIQLFTFTEKEQQKFLQKYVQTEKEDQEAEKYKPQDIYDIYLGDESQRQEIKSATDKIIEATNKESNKVADRFYDDLLQRRRPEIIASLKILAQIGFLDDLIAKDQRFKDLLIGYFKRNNLLDLLKNYQQKPTDLVYIKHFLKYVFMERLGMSQDDAARYALQLSNIFREQGVQELSQLAYYDMASEQFYWL